MTKPFYSNHWYRVASLKPRLRNHVRFQRQYFRDHPWYVLEDPSSHRYYRFSPAAHSLIQLMDGRHSVQEIWEEACATCPAESPSQDDVLQLLTQLHAADGLEYQDGADIGWIVNNHGQVERRRWHSALLNPLSLKFPLFDPDAALDRYLPIVCRVFSRIGGLIWFAIVSCAAIIGVMHWQDLTHDITDRVLAPQNLILLWLLFPVLKTVHELGHAFAIKKYGGEVHEIGMMLLLLQPVPYVDASSAYAFREKWQRILVGSAGMLAEMFVAAIAIFVWIAAEPGVVRTLAYNTIFISGISTLVFNANPLLRYDGYYIFSDFLEIPNLRGRAETYVRYLGERWLFGTAEPAEDLPSGSERFWLTIYPFASWAYRTVVVFAIAIFTAEKFFFFGVAIAASGLLSGFCLPIVKLVTGLWGDARMNGTRRWAVMAIFAVPAAVLVFVFAVPLPLRTRAEGVMWISDEAQVRAGADGFIERVVAQPGSQVRAGDVLIICRDPQLDAQVKVLEFRLAELKTRYAAQWLEDIKQAQIIKDEISHIEQRLAHARNRSAQLVIRSRAVGSFVVAQPENLPGRFVQQGARLGYILDYSSRRARVVVPQAAIDLVRGRNRNIEVRLAERVSEPMQAQLVRQVPAATEQLPSTALGTQGGGSVLVDPGDQRGVKALEKLFQLELALPQAAQNAKFGGRVYVRFDHGWEPVAYRWVRALRQLFLSEFNR